MDFLVVVEAKCHRNAIKRDVVQTLHAKMRSVGAHKGVVVATAPFQRGALEYARVHGIALVLVTAEEVRYEMRWLTFPDVGREAASIRSGGLAAEHWAQGEDRSLMGTVIIGDHARLLLA